MLTQKFWKKYFKQYDVLRELIPYRELLEGLRGKIEPGRSRLLDLGSGTGNFCEILGGSIPERYGIDSSSAGIELHRKKDPHAEVCHGDITQPLPFEDNFFDVVVSNNVLYTLDRAARARVMGEVYRVLEPGGRVVIANLNTYFRPTDIYREHIKKSMRAFGVWRSAGRLIALLRPTVLLFYYNYLINKENKDGQYEFFDPGEHADLLRRAGFEQIHEEEGLYYAGGASLVTGVKPTK